jgi:beta-galactosidase GanA
MLRATIAFCALAVQALFAAAGQTFSIANDQFVLNGKPILLMSGCIHYSRVRPEDWADRLARVAALGANAIETYVPWNFHETNQGAV